MPDDFPLPQDVLIVEDDPIIVLDTEDTILGLGVGTVRIASSVVRALAMIADQPPDFALLDIGLRNETSFAIAERLEAMGIRFAFVTGYSTKSAFPDAFAHRPKLTKPYSPEALLAVLRGQSPEEG